MEQPQQSSDSYKYSGNPPWTCRECGYRVYHDEPLSKCDFCGEGRLHHNVCLKEHEERCGRIFGPQQHIPIPVPGVANPENAMVTTTDWYAPHLSAEALSDARKRTKSPTLLIGGGNTGEAAICDETPHRFLALRYKEQAAMAAAAAVVAQQDSPQQPPGQEPAIAAAEQRLSTPTESVTGDDFETEMPP